MSFNDKVVIVTGSSSGIGAATAISFAEQGAKVVLVGRDKANLKDVAAKCERHGAKTLSIIGDVTKDDVNKGIISKTINQFGKIDILVNNVGVAGESLIWDDDIMELFDRIIATNLRSVVHLTSLAAKHLIETKGNIINISSAVSMGVFAPGHSAYCTSKAGLDHFTRSVALDLAQKGVRVNAINPGPVKTNLIRGFKMDKEKEAEMMKNVGNMTATGRVSEPQEIADVVLFLASDKAKAVTGSIYLADNGFLLKK